MPQIGSIWITLDVDINRMSRMQQAARTVETSSRRMRNSLDATGTSVTALRAKMNTPMRMRLLEDASRTILRTNDEVNRLKASMLALSAVMGAGFTAGLGAAFIIQTADKAKLLANQLRTVTTDMADLAATQAALSDVSTRTRSSLESTIRIYARTARAVEHLSMSQKELLTVTETIQKAFAIGGATQAEATGAAIQLSQGIASDRFSGEEFRSVAENAPVLLQEMARTMNATIGELREMAHAGLLDAETTVNAILQASEAINKTFEGIQPTVAQGFTLLNNALIEYLGSVDQAYNVTGSFAGGLMNLAENFDAVAGTISAALEILAAWAGGQFLLAPMASILKAYQAQGAEIQKQIVLHQQKISTIQKERAATLQAIGDRKIAFGLALQERRAAIAGSEAQVLAEKAVTNERRKLRGLVAETVALRGRERVLAEQTAAAEARLTATRSRMMGLMGGAAKGLWSMVGGLPGLITGALLYGVFQYQKSIAKAAEETRQVTEYLREMGVLTKEASDEMIRFGDAVAAGRFDQLVVMSTRLTEELKKNAAAVRELNEEIAKIASLEGLGMPDRSTQSLTAEEVKFRREAQEAIKRAEKISEHSLKAEEFTEGQERALIAIGAKYPEIAVQVNDLINKLRLQSDLYEGQKKQVEGISDAWHDLNKTSGPTPLTAVPEMMNRIKAAEMSADKIVRKQKESADEILRQAGLSERARLIEEERAKLAEGFNEKQSKNVYWLDEYLDRQARMNVNMNIAIERAKQLRDIFAEVATEASDIDFNSKALQELVDKADKILNEAMGEAELNKVFDSIGAQLAAIVPQGSLDQATGALSALEKILTDAGTSGNQARIYIDQFTNALMKAGVISNVEAANISKALASAAHSAQEFNRAFPKDPSGSGLVTVTRDGVKETYKLGDAIKQNIGGGKWVVNEYAKSVEDATKSAKGLVDTTDEVRGSVIRGLDTQREATEAAKSEFQRLLDALQEVKSGADTTTEGMTSIGNSGTVAASRVANGFEITKGVLESAISVVNSLDQAIQSIKDKVVTVTVRTVEAVGGAAGSTGSAGYGYGGNAGSYSEYSPSSSGGSTSYSSTYGGMYGAGSYSDSGSSAYSSGLASGTGIYSNFTSSGTYASGSGSATNVMYADGLGYAGGGEVKGKGTGKSDDILAFLSNGEFVVNADSTKRYKELLYAINNAPKLAEGGFLSSPMLSGGTFAPSDDIWGWGSGTTSYGDTMAIGQAMRGTLSYSTSVGFPSMSGDQFRVPSVAPWGSTSDRSWQATYDGGASRNSDKGGVDINNTIIVQGSVDTSAVQRMSDEMRRGVQDLIGV